MDRASSFQRRTAAVLAVPVLFALSAGSAFAQHGVETPEHGAHAEEHHWWPNHISVTVGGASATGENKTDFTTGAEYERRLTDLWGLGVLWEFVFGDQKRQMVWGVPLSLHPVADLRIVAAPLLELLREKEVDGDQFKGGIRIGVDYEFEVGRHWSVAPLFFVDIIDSQAILIYGVAGGVFF